MNIASKEKNPKAFVQEYECISSLGLGAGEGYKKLCSGKLGSFSKPNISSWPQPVQSKIQERYHKQQREPGWFKIQSQPDSHLELWTKSLRKILAGFKVENKDSLGVILATTKGITEDFIWDKVSTYQCPYRPLTDFLKSEFDLPNPHIVNQACASGSIALGVAARWIQEGVYEDVLVIAGDLIGTFVYSGFQSLAAMSASKAKPFGKNRDGLSLGEAIGAVYLSSKPSELEVCGGDFANDGDGLIRPTNAHKILESLYGSLENKSPDFIMSHGTGTYFNDAAELKAISSSFSNSQLLATKHFIGHTMAASGLVDFIFSCELLKNRESWSLGNYLIDDNAKKYTSNRAGEFRSVLLHSLGFGGVTSILELQSLKGDF